MLVEHHGGCYISILDDDSFTFLLDLPMTSQKGKHWSRYDLGVAFSRTLYGNFVLNANFWSILSFLLDFTCFFTTTRSTVSNYLMILNLLHSSLCFSLFPDTRILNISICINRSGDPFSKLYTDSFPSEVPSLDLSGDRSIRNGKSLTIATTDQAISVPSTGPAYQYYNAKNTPCNYWWRLNLYTEFIFCTLFKYILKNSFITYLWWPLATSCNGISKVSW